MSEYEDVIASDAALNTPGMTTSVLLHAPPVFTGMNKVYDLIVSNPQKQTEKTFSYVAYTIKVKKLREGTEVSSFRRYSDFLWLHDTLRAIHPSCVVPPLPEKALGSKFSSDLLLYRSRELTRFLQRIADHPVLCEDDSFAFFLTAPWAEFTDKRSTSSPAPSTTGSSSGSNATAPQSQGKFAELFSSITKSASHALTSISFAMGKEKPIDPDSWFNEQAERMDQLEASLTQALISTNGIARRLREASPIDATSAMNLRLLGRVLATTDEQSAIACSEISKATEQSVKLTDELANQVEHNVHDNIKDYIRELDEIRAVLEARMEHVRRYTVCSSNAQAKKGKGTASEIEEAEHQRDLALSDLDAFSKAARADIMRVYATRKSEFARVLNGFAIVNRDYAIQTSDAWKEAATASTPDKNIPASTSEQPQIGLQMQDLQSTSSSSSSSTATTTTTNTTTTTENVASDLQKESQPAPVSPYSIDD